MDSAAALTKLARSPEVRFYRRHRGRGAIGGMRERLARLRRTLEALFPERHLYVRSGGRMRAYVLSPRRQMLAASGIAATALWTGVASAAPPVGQLRRPGSRPHPDPAPLFRR